MSLRVKKKVKKSMRNIHLLPKREIETRSTRQESIKATLLSSLSLPFSPLPSPDASVPLS